MTEENASKETSNKCGGKNKAMLAYGVVRDLRHRCFRHFGGNRFWSLCCETGEQSVQRVRPRGHR